MPKNIVILLDGTSNEISANRTNVLRLYGTLEKSAAQLVYYDPGVGTFGAEGAWLSFWRKAVEIWGLATGWGLDQNVKEAYSFLVENYDHGGKDGERDSIYLFGFSRGAYTARVLAGFINAVGLLEARNLNLLDYAYRAYKAIGEKPETFAEVRLYERILAPDRPPIRLLGLFDTVASVIEHGRYGPQLRSHAFTRTNPSVESVRHAVAIDERRSLFRPQLWPAGGQYLGNPFNHSAPRPQDVKEVWFAGGHGDVGGGYPEAESALAKMPLAWMIDETGALGLRYRTQTVNDIVLGTNPAKPGYVRPDALARAHDTRTWLWALLEVIPRRGPGGWFLPLFSRRPIASTASIHQSVFDRAAAGIALSPNVPPGAAPPIAAPPAAGAAPTPAARRARAARPIRK